MTVTAYSRQFKQLVRVEIPDGDIEDFTTTDATWSLAFKQYAEIMPLAGDEQVAALQINPRISQRIRMRWVDDYSTTRTRFVYGSRVFYVASTRNLDERNRIWEFWCVEEVA